jgi:hypothetical protein
MGTRPKLTFIDGVRIGDLPIHEEQLVTELVQDSGGIEDKTPGGQECRELLKLMDTWIGVVSTRAEWKMDPSILLNALEINLRRMRDPGVDDAARGLRVWIEAWEDFKSDSEP